MFESEEDKVIVADEEAEEVEEIVIESRQRPGSDARRRLETCWKKSAYVMNLEDFLDYY